MARGAGAPLQLVLVALSTLSGAVAQRFPCNARGVETEGGHHDPLVHPPPRWAPVSALAGAQGGAIGREQLRALGFGPDAVRSLVRRRVLHRHSRDVFIVGHPHLGRIGRLHAALLAAGPAAALSHRTAAAVWDLRPTARRRVEVTVVRGGRRGDDELQIHRVRSLHERDVTERDGLSVTTVARTLLDLADVVNDRDLHRALEQALILRRFDAAAVDDVVNRANGRRGARRLRTLVRGLTDTPPHTRSHLERRFLAFCSAHDLPRPQTNAWVAGHEVDAYWPDARLVVELDGRQTHDTPIAFERDRERDRALAVAGERVIRLTDRQLATGGTRLAADLRALVDRSLTAGV
jgi:very-short-patch-repair endonuclease